VSNHHQQSNKNGPSKTRWAGDAHKVRASGAVRQAPFELAWDSCVQQMHAQQQQQVQVQMQVVVMVARTRRLPCLLCLTSKRFCRRTAL